MYRILLFSFFIISLNGFAQDVEQTYRNPVIPGDFPDPTVIRVGNDYYASATTSDFVPCFPLYHSSDLINWNRIGFIFDTLPEWVKGDCWAPELFYDNGTFYIYYTARKKENNISCIGVATTKDITKGFEDKGVLIEWGSEAIDAFVFKDDDGKRYVSWKAYGLDADRPIEILCSELSADGLSLTGEPFTLTDRTKGQPEHGEEGQSLIRHGEYYYLFYSIGGCCDNRCDYRVHVARSKDLQSGWEQYDKNPLLQGGGLWKCSGHGTPVQTPDNRCFYLYHAYHQYDFEFVGRQGLLDEIIWDEKTGWPYFRYGNIPSVQAAVPAGGVVQKRNERFYDNFHTPENDIYWLRDMNSTAPGLLKEDGKLTITALEPGFCFRGINPQTGNYTMETSVIRNGGKNLKGLCIYGNGKNMLLWGIEGTTLKLYKSENNVKSEICSRDIDSRKIYLRIASINARSFRFYWSENNEDWSVYPEPGETISGEFLPQWGKGVRAGLIVENKDNDNTGTFAFFSFENK